MLRKTGYSLLCALFAAVPACLAQQFSYDDTTWDFGVIREEAGPVTHRFRVTNTGKYPLAIHRVTASCGCTTPTFPRSLILPGRSGYVTVRFDPAGYRGEVSKSLVVISNGGKNEDRLRIRGRVVPRKRTPEEEYPAALRCGLRLSDTLVRFRPIAQHTSATLAVRCMNTSDKDLSIALRHETQSGLLHVDLPAVLPAKGKGEIRFTYDLRYTPPRYGVLKDVCRIAAGDGAALRITVSATAVDRFAADPGPAPRTTLSSQYIGFGALGRTAPCTRSLTVRNEGDAELIIRSVNADPSLEVIRLQAGERLAPGESRSFLIRLLPARLPAGRYLGRIVLTTNDPLRPVREIKITAQLQ